MNSTAYAYVALAIAALVTALIRGAPFVLFGGKREMPPAVRYLGSVLPPAIMIILVVYCLREIRVTDFPFGLPELISVAVTAALQLWRKNTFLSILLGTACYMLLIRTLFAGG